MYKFVIASAGLGSRVGIFSKFMNKAMISIGNKPAICHIIDKIPSNIEIVILIGYKGNLLQEVLLEIYNDRKLIFVNVDKYSGKGASLGYSLICAQDKLQCPFIFCTNDTLIKEKISLDPSKYGNWLGYYRKIDGDRIDIQQYRTLEISKKKVSNIHPKGIINKNIYIGLAGINDYINFWEIMKNNPNIEAGESIGLSNLDSKKAIEFKSWRDTGNLNSLYKIQQEFNDSSTNILPKEDEAIWFVNGKVIKFHQDKKFISDRVTRTQYLPKKMIPKLLNRGINYYSYQKIQGAVISKAINKKKLLKLLDDMQTNLWSNTAKKNIRFKKANKNFYYDKTVERVNGYLKKYEIIDKNEVINGIYCNNIFKTLSKIKWEILYDDYIYSNFHGDFHNENILIDKNDNFYLIDWRQNFGTNLYEYGDVYYDLAKFYHGLLVSHNSVRLNKFSIKYEKNEVIINILRPNNLLKLETIFFQWVKKMGYNEYKIKILTYLIFINIALLHEPPYSNFLYKFGKYNLNKILLKKVYS